jgi:hypothetical protein
VKTKCLRIEVRFAMKRYLSSVEVGFGVGYQKLLEKLIMEMKIKPRFYSRQQAIISSMCELEFSFVFPPQQFFIHKTHANSLGIVWFPRKLLFSANISSVEWKKFIDKHKAENSS